MMILCETDAWRKRKKEKSSRVEKILIATFLSKIKTNKEESMTCFIIHFLYFIVVEYEELLYQCIEPFFFH